MTKDKKEELVKSWIRLCTDPRTPSEQLENAAYWESINQPNDFQIRLAAARHRSASSELLAKLSMTNSLAVQIAVAGHPNLLESTAGKLLRKHLRELRRALAGNPKIPALPRNLMAMLMTHKEREVRAALAQNRNIATALLEKLSHDKDELVRATVVQHYKIPLAGLRALALDKSQRVREIIFARALEEFPTDKALFQALSKTRPSLVAQRAEQVLAELDARMLEAPSLPEEEPGGEPKEES